MAAQQKYIWSPRQKKIKKKKCNTQAFVFFKTFQGDSDMHMDFEK